MIQPYPFIKDETPGKKAWCACGKTQTEPYCDGSHSKLNTGKTPVVVEITAAKKYAWCGCRKTQNPPYCDGSHSTC